ncbi:MAG: uracil-DNA glycosylase [Alphaproteobacteria bacterium]|nr:uracil-DNA glycosylase [Alphaproteobacteria bacterium]
MTIRLEASDPPLDCGSCPRLVAYRTQNAGSYPDYFNAPVPSFGPRTARLLIVGLAPGLKGANRTGRPFTGDHAGDLLYPTLVSHGFAEGSYRADPDDGLTLKDCRITNAVRCVPPQNKPIGAEVSSCRGFLADTLAEMDNLRVVLVLGGLAHGAVLATLDLRKSAFKFQHAGVEDLPEDRMLLSSYHCSRYNTNTGRLTEEMFHQVFAKAQDLIAR